MPAIVEKDNGLIRHCRASKYKNGPVVGVVGYTLGCAVEATILYV